MQEKSFLTYQTFTDRSVANEFTEILKAGNIEFLIEEESTGMIPGFENNELSRDYRIKIKQEDFSSADKACYIYFEKHLNDFDKSYYLFDFSNDELIDLLSKRDEWGPFDYLLAKKILIDRGVDINDDVLESFQKKRIEQLSSPGNSEKLWIYVGYLSSLLGGFFGILLGLILVTHKKTLPNGERVWGFSSSDRLHGKRILVIGLIIFMLLFLIWIASTRVIYD